ncbi:MAG: hypothetical protein EZS28_011854 [Streblomastix strix]|uniref:Uncharacterized protein n=1 Tax=Streblomastix strix TaxID=222440 RepID=A0A5J4WDV1_9EUKA|nr:MAG: hypothetical protein EZS28_011854 [Streblomastix strix]
MSTKYLGWAHKEWVVTFSKKLIGSIYHSGWYSLINEVIYAKRMIRFIIVFICRYGSLGVVCKLVNLFQ